MKRICKYVFLFGFIVGLCAGCGGEYEEKNPSGVSGGAVSGDAIKEESAREKRRDMSEYRFCTDTNLYLYFDLEGEQTIMQARLDGTHMKGIIERALSLNYVTEDWLYYSIWRDNQIVMCRVPIGKDSEGYDVVDESQMEIVMSDHVVYHFFYVDSDYLFYSREIDDEIYEPVKYDLEKKEYSVQEITLDEPIGGIWRVGDQYIMMTDTEEYIFAQPVDGTEWINLNRGYLLEGHWAYNDRLFFYDGFPIEGDEGNTGPDSWYKYGTNIRMYDEKKEQSFVTWEQLRESVEEAEKLKEKNGELTMCEVDDLYCQNDRCYVQVQAKWIRDGIYYEKYLIFSKDEKEKELHYEKELTECMRKQVKTREKKNAIVNNARCAEMINGEALLMLYDYDKKERRVAAYKLDSGEFRWLERSGEIFYDKWRVINIEDGWLNITDGIR